MPRAARGAAPVKVSGGFLTFIHKTVQENLVALALCRSIRESCNSTGLSMSKLMKAMLEFYSPGTIRDKQARRSSLSAAAASTTALTVAEERALARQRQAMIEALMDEVKNSPIGVIALESEPAVRDFIADRLLDDSILAAAAHCVAILAICSDSELVAENMKAIYGSAMPRRKNGTLLHEAAAAGNERLVLQVLHVMEAVEVAKEGEGGSCGTRCDAGRGDIVGAWKGRKMAGGADVFPLDLQNDDGETALLRAVKSGDVKTLQVLLDCRADPSKRSKMNGGVPLVQLLGPSDAVQEMTSAGGRMKSKAVDGVVPFEKDFGEFVVGFPRASVPADAGGKVYFFEVEIRERFVGNKCRLFVGLSKGMERSTVVEKHLGEAEGASPWT